MKYLFVIAMWLGLALAPVAGMAAPVQAHVAPCVPLDCSDCDHEEPCDGGDCACVSVLAPIIANLEPWELRLPSLGGGWILAYHEASRWLDWAPPSPPPRF